MQREIFPMSDHWKMGEQCSCSGRLKVRNICHWEPLKSEVTAICEDCGDGWQIEIKKKRVYVNPDKKVAG